MFPTIQQNPVICKYDQKFIKHGEIKMIAVGAWIIKLLNILSAMENKNGTWQQK